MKTITVRRDLTINTGNFSNVKIGFELTTDELDWNNAWNEVEEQSNLQRDIEISKLTLKETVKEVKPF